VCSDVWCARTCDVAGVFSQVEPITRIEVMGKSADQVVEEVLKKVGTSSGDKTGKVSSVVRGQATREAKQ